MRRALVFLTLAALATLAPAAGAEVVWLETERFQDPGGWTNDSQFIDQMGSPYLLAVGLGEPVKDAVTHVDLPQAGRRRLWVRSRDWVPEHHPGRFNVLLGGKPADPVFGASGKPGWHWEDGGVHDLSGRVEIRLHDLTGYYARCDCLLMTSDLAWTPPDAKDAVAALREQHGGVSREVKNMPPHDVVVIGGGLAGCTAAVAAARMGASVVLIQDRPVLGGNASPEILVPPVGVWPHGGKLSPLDPRETGLVEEYRTAGNQRVSEGKLYAERLARFVKLEPNLDLCLNTRATGVQMQPGPGRKIAGVLAVDVTTGQRMEFAGKVFIDCTGDGVVGVAAGAEYRHGKEPKSMYNEPWAPAVENKNTMGNSLKYFHQDTGKPQPFEAPPWVYKFPTCESFAPGRHPRFITSEDIGEQWRIELGGLQDTYADAEEIRDNLLRLVYGLWDHTKNHCPRDKAKAATHRLVWVAYVQGKRESRRLIGDYVLTQNDIGAQTLFPDRVAYGGWSIDDHHSEGFFHNGSFGLSQDDKKNAYHALPFSIPFRCLYSKNVDNLLMAGRDISASHLGMSDTRVMLTCAVMGQAAGTGAALCVGHQATPRGIYEKHIEELQQQLLKDGAYIIDLPNRDPRDLARKAAASASSEGTSPKGEKMAAANAIDGYARALGDKTSAWAPDDAAKGPHWLQLAWPQPQTFNVVHVAFQTAALAPKRFAVEAWQDGRWKPVAEVTENRHRRHVLGLDRLTASRLRVVLDEPRGLCEVRVYDEPERIVEIARRAERNMRLPDVGPWLPWDKGKARQAAATQAPAEAPRGFSLEEAAKKFGGAVLDASQAQLTGEWAPSTYSTPFIADGYLTDGNTGKGAKSICFKPNLAKAGTYEVRLAYTPLKNRATNVPVTVTTPRGSKTVQVNERQAPEVGGLFHSLGKFDLDAGDATSIVISNAGTDGYVVVDAVQILP
jgi:hypothetical protein